MRPTICLIALVKNEEPVITRCLEAVRPWIDSWVIFDTGSTDETMAVIEEAMADVPGELHARPDLGPQIRDRGFAEARSELMAAARNREDADYLLMIDADDTWMPDAGFAWPDLTADAYEIKLVMGNTSWFRTQITRAMKPWRYEGRAHEYLVCDEPFVRGGILPKVAIRCGNDGHRRRTEGREKYKRIAALLEKELEEKPDDPRATFYLAQSYRDAGERHKALQMYERRAKLGGWPQETWHAMFQVGILHEQLGHPWETIRTAHERAFNFLPSRAEPLVELARYARRKRQEHARAFMYATTAKEIPYPTGGLFIDESAYAWRALDECAVAAYWIGRHDIAIAANLRLLQGSTLPAQQIDRIEKNLMFSLTKTRPTTPIGPKVRYGDRVTVVVPTYRCDPPRLRRAVQSILAQTYENLICVVVSDGDETPPWSALEDIEDARLYLHHVPENCGQFFAMDAVLRATPDPMFAVQDDDDESAPERIEKLVRKMAQTGADIVFSHLEKRYEGRRSVQRCRPSRIVAFTQQALVHVGSHLGLINKEALLRVGGYLGPVRLGYDTLIVDALSRLGRPAFVHEILYHQDLRSHSMTMSPETNMQSSARQADFAKLRTLWEQIVADDDPIDGAERITRPRPEIEEERAVQTRAIWDLLHERARDTARSMPKCSAGA